MSLALYRCEIQVTRLLLIHCSIIALADAFIFSHVSSEAFLGDSHAVAPFTISWSPQTSKAVCMHVAHTWYVSSPLRQSESDLGKTDEALCGKSHEVGTDGAEGVFMACEDIREVCIYPFLSVFFLCFGAWSS